MEWWCAAGTWDHEDPPPGFDRYVVKTTTVVPRKGSDAREIIGGSTMVNRVGVTNPGIAETLRSLDAIPVSREVLVLSILGTNEYEWWVLGAMCEAVGIPAVEMNMSCPNFGELQTPESLRRAIDALTGFYTGALGVKLGPDTTHLASSLGGAQWVAVSNTLPSSLGGVSGNALRPFALKAIREVRERTTIPIIGGGGVGCRDTPEEDAEAYIKAGATSVFIGTANLLR